MLRANVASYTLNPLSSGQMRASESSSLLISTHCQCPPELEGVPSDSASLPRCLWTWQAGEVEKYWLVNTTPFRGCLLLVNIPPFTGDSEPIIKVVVCPGSWLEQEMYSAGSLGPLLVALFLQVVEIGIGKDRGVNRSQISLFSCQTLCFFVHQDVTNIKYLTPASPYHDICTLSKQVNK